MTKLTKKRIDVIASWARRYGKKHNVMMGAGEAEERLAEYEKAAQESVAWIWNAYGREYVTNSCSHAEELRKDGVELQPLYCGPAPLLPEPPKVYNIGDATMRHVFTPTGMMDLSDMQSVFDQVETALIALEKPSAPVMPDELLESIEEVLRISDRKHDAWDRAKAAISAYRAAMLSSSTDKPAPTLDSSPKNGELSSASAIPAGWKLVPEDPPVAMLLMLGLTGSFDSMIAAYKKMLAGVPQPEGEITEPMTGIDLSGAMKRAIRDEVLDVLNEERRCGGGMSKW